MNTEITKFVEYTAKRLLDGVLFNSDNNIRVSEEFDGRDIYASLKSGQTRNILFKNMDQFNAEFNKLMHSRLYYLHAEGFLTIEDGCYRAFTEEELEEFIAVE
jgi:hypothetical protein